MSLAAEAITKSYHTEVLRNCSLTVAPGECVVVRGVSGGGKSTLLRILARLEPANAGVLVHGERRFDATTVTDEPVYPFLTLVFQQLFLWPNLTIGQNLAIVLEKHPRARLQPAALSLLDRMGVAALLRYRPHECSLGQRQRVAVARALLSDARFLLLDEPSSALDAAARRVLANELIATKRAGRGLLIVTHDERDFDSLADQRLLLEHGGLTPC